MSNTEQTPHFDSVNHPVHYTSGGVETIDLIEAKELNFCLGNVIKYVCRCGRKRSLGIDERMKALEDLKKARWYLDREIAARTEKYSKRLDTEEK